MKASLDPRAILRDTCFDKLSTNGGEYRAYFLPFALSLSKGVSLASAV